MNKQNINWPKFWTGLGAAFASLLGGLAALPYTLGEISEIIPPAWKPRIAIAGFVAAFILRTFYGAIPTKTTTPQ